MLFFLTGRPDLVRKAARSCAEDLLLPALPAPEKGSARTESLTSDAIILENTEPDFLTLPPGQTCILAGPEEPEEALTSSEELSGRAAAPENPAIPRFAIRSEGDFSKVSAWIIRRPIWKRSANFSEIPSGTSAKRITLPPSDRPGSPALIRKSGAGPCGNIRPLWLNSGRGSWALPIWTGICLTGCMCTDTLRGGAWAAR